MARYRLIVSYDGTDFCGWQRQKEHKHASPLPTIQETLEKALSEILNHEVNISGSGRTDAGVHAVGQVCHFDTDRKLPIDLCWALKSKLPTTISAKAVQPVAEKFHATISARRKTYRYWIWNHPRAPALLQRYTWWLRQNLDIDRLNQLSDAILGEHDFESFRSVGTVVRHTVRRIDRARWIRKHGGLVEFTITGNGFMKQMVRNLVGTMVDLSLKGVGPEKMKEIISLRDRTRAGRAAPPQGLFLISVEYPSELISRPSEVDFPHPET